MRSKTLLMLSATAMSPFYAMAGEAVPNEVIERQRANLKANTQDKGFGPQSPRDIDNVHGRNRVVFSPAPDSSVMNLCNIHFHKSAEHKGGEFTKYAGNGNGKGYQSGYLYSGTQTQAELSPIGHDICPSPKGGLKPGDTIETHYVYSSAQVTPGPSLGSCMSDAIKNPQLRVEAQVYVLVNDANAADFVSLNEHKGQHGFHQAVNIPNNTGTPVQYAGSTTGPKYNEKGSPLQVTWNVRPNVTKVNIESVGKWCKDNAFDEHSAHGVRNLILNPDLLSTIQ